MVTLVRPGPTILRASASGLPEPSNASPTLTDQPESSASTLIRRGRSSLSRTTWASSSSATLALRMVRLVSWLSVVTSIAALVSNTSQSVSAR